MNIIERLGGYEETKKILYGYKNFGWKTQAVEMHFGFGFTIKDLDVALLEHRRQHNIYEVDDYVVCGVTDRIGLIDCFIGDYFCMVKIPNDVGGFTFIKNHIEAIKHATDEEIKAGRRL